MRVERAHKLARKHVNHTTRLGRTNQRHGASMRATALVLIADPTTSCCKSGSADKRRKQTSSTSKTLLSPRAPRAATGRGEAVDSWPTRKHCPAVTMQRPALRFLASDSAAFVQAYVRGLKVNTLIWVLTTTTPFPSSAPIQLTNENIGHELHMEPNASDEQKRKSHMRPAALHSPRPAKCAEARDARRQRS